MPRLSLRDPAFLATAAGAGAITPASFAGLHRWWKGDSFISLVDGNNCCTLANPWIDQASSGQDAYNNATPPVWKDSTNYGKPYVQFGLMALITNAAVGSLTDFTILCANKKTNTNSFILIHNITGDQLRRAFLDGPTLFFDGTGGGQAANAFANPNSFNLTVCRRSGTTVSFRENKTSRGSFTYASAGFATNEIGSSANGSFIDMGELVIYNTVLSDADLDALYDSYFKPRFTILP